MSQGNYGLALYALAKDEQLDKEILEQLQVLDTAFSQEPDFLRLLATPNLSKEERCSLVDDSFRGKVHPYVLNLLKVLTEAGIARTFGACCQAYRQQFNEDNNIIRVQAVTAMALSETQIEKLSQKLTQVTGKTVDLHFRIDPECLGGIRLDYDGKQVDGTVKNRLDNLRNELMR